MASVGGWDDRVVADRELVAEIAGRYLPAGVAARWLRLLRPAAALRYAGPGARVAAVLGGLPWLPGSVEWPAWEGHGPLSYIGVIDCSALRAVPLDVAVPQAGMLQFFYFDGQLDDGRAIVYPEEPETLAGARVLYLRPGQAAAPRQCPAGLTPYERVGLAAEPVVTFPGFEHPDLQAAFNPSGEDLRSFLDHPVNGEAFTQALSRRRAGPCHQVGGYATPVQGPVESDAAVAALGGGEPGDDELLAEQARWRLLAQIDSDDRAGMMWGDAGTLYWLCRSAEMTGGQLPETTFTWQCC
jgi:hypothetical protein